MKIRLIAVAIILMFGVVKGQSNIEIGGYGGGSADMTTINGDLALTIGGHGGVLLDNRWLIGIGGYNSFFKYEKPDGEKKLQFNHYGLYTEYRFNPKSRVGLVTGLLVGGGFLDSEDRPGKIGENGRDGDFVYVVQPAVKLSVGITSYLKVELKAGYRFTGNPGAQLYDKNNMNGLTTGITIIAGSF